MSHSPPTARRRFWQIHLSSMILGVLTCGVLLMLNQRNSTISLWFIDGPSSSRTFSEDEMLKESKENKHIRTWTRMEQDRTAHGWPLYFLEDELVIPEDNMVMIMERKFHDDRFAIDAAVALSILAVVIMLSETLARSVRRS